MGPGACGGTCVRASLRRHTAGVTQTVRHKGTLTTKCSFHKRASDKRQPDKRPNAHFPYNKRYMNSYTTIPLLHHRNGQGLFALVRTSTLSLRL